MEIPVTTVEEMGVGHFFVGTDSRREVAYLYLGLRQDNSGNLIARVFRIDRVVKGRDNVFKLIPKGTATFKPREEVVPVHFVD